MKGRYPRALVAAAATNPLVWAAALVALMLAVCALVVLLYVAAWALIRDELCSTRATTEPAVTPPAEDDWPLNEPTPGFDTHLDEHGRVELLTHEPEPFPVAPPPAVPEPAPDRKPRARKGGRRKNGVPAEPEHCNDLTHADLVQLAHQAGAKNANKRWTRGRLVAVVSAPCSRKEAR